MSNYQVLDSGERIDFSTGSKRDTNEGKPRFDLISVFGMRELAIHMAKGAAKYGERNWELGQPTSRSYESAVRHLNMWQYDDSENHLAAAVFNIFSIIHVKTMIAMGRLDPSLDDANRFLPKPLVAVPYDGYAATLNKHYEGLTNEEKLQALGIDLEKERKALKEDKQWACSCPECMAEREALMQPHFNLSNDGSPTK